VNPKAFIFYIGKDILVNGVNIYADITDAEKQWENKNYEAFGHDVGDALGQIT
jgi:hypothetical protein